MVTSQSGLTASSGEPLKTAYDLLMPLEKRVQTWLDTPAGHLDLPLVSDDHLHAALNGSYLANFINTVQLEASGAQIASSALPNEFKGLPTEVTIRDVVSTYIYTNTLVVLEMTRPALKQYIERSAAYFDHDEDGNLCIADEFLRPKVQHYNYDFFSGIHYTIDARNPVGQRVTSIVLDVRVGGQPSTAASWARMSRSPSASTAIASAARAATICCPGRRLPARCSPT